MLNIKSLQYVLGVILSGFVIAPSQAIEKESAAHIQALCGAYHKTGGVEAEAAEAGIGGQHAKSLCAMYIKGFLAGKEVHRNKHMPKQTFEQRALKTRAGNMAEKRYSLESPDYCIPENTTLAEIALLIDKASARPDTSAEVLIENVLEQNYRCA